MLLVCWTPDQAVWFRVLARDIVCVVFLGKHFTLAVPLSTLVSKWVLGNLMREGGNPVID